MSTRPDTPPVLVTCEHGGNDVPPEHRALFRGHRALLDSHRGWDPGTLHLARLLGARLEAPVVEATVTRLLVDLNRSPHNPRVFSEVTRPLTRAVRVELLERYHAPHWAAVREASRSARRPDRPLLHLGIHSFTPVLAGQARRADLALLYDPARPGELALASAWARALALRLPEHTIARNDPYRGRADGLTTALRKEHPEGEYLGIEVEVNQRHVGGDGRFPTWVAEALLATLPAAEEAVS